MKVKFNILLYTVVVLVINNSVAQSQIPVFQNTIWKNAGYNGDIPEINKSIINVLDYGAKGDSVTNNYPIVQSLINSAVAPAVIYFPPGIYRFESYLTLKSGIVLRGGGYKSTRLDFNSANGCVSINGTVGSYVDILDGHTKGSNKIVVTDASRFIAGQGGEIRQGNVYPTTYTNWVEPFSIGQMVRILSKNGDTLTIEPALNFDYKSNPPLVATNGPEIAPVNYVENAGIEDIHVKRLDNGGSESNFNINRAANCWFRRMESDFTLKYHFSVTRSLNLEIRDNYIHHAKSRGDGGQGYGVSLASYVTSSLIENNIFYLLRHSMIVQIGVNGCVFGYNYAERNYSDDGWDKPAISIHGHYSYNNLYEGNIIGWVGVGDYWGPDGPGHTVFRNRAMGTNGGDNFGAFGNRHGIELKDFKGTQYVIGNEIVGGGIFYFQGNTIVDISLADAVVHGNNVKGTVQWDPKITDHTIPASLYLSTKPDFFDDLPWPAFGSDIAFNSNKIPALVRREKSEFIPERNYKTFKHLTICDGDSIIINGKYQKTTGNYNDTLQAASGYDSIIITDLKVNPAYKIIKNVTINPGESYFAEGKYQTTSGIYRDTYKTISGCDSAIFTSLTVGNYELVQTDNILIMPNPNSDYLVLSIERTVISNFSYMLYDIKGRLLQNERINSNTTNIYINNLVPATYFLRVMQGKKEIKSFKIIKN